MTSHTEGSGLPSALTQMPESWLEGYKALSSATQAIADRWIKHRTEQIQTNLDAFSKIAACKDAGEIAQIHQRWLTQTVDRLNDEFRDFQEQIAEVSQLGFAGFGQVRPPRQPRPPVKAA